MAEKLARIFCTEEDKVNCPFYYKTGVWRHKDSCTRIHNKPIVSQTLIFHHLYDNPSPAVAFADGMEVEDSLLEAAVHHFEEFYIDIFLEFIKFGKVEEIHVSDNISEHSIGNVYVKYSNEEGSKNWFENLNWKYYEGRQIYVEYSPVTDFKDAKCRLYNDGSWERGGYCNFMHLKYVNKSFIKALKKSMYELYPEYKESKNAFRNQQGVKRARDFEREDTNTVSHSKRPREEIDDLNIDEMQY